ncbi:hypothetical protein [Microvirga thermotolerans]|uniref:Uncharacterized protein n=1 Tax=Microvirga thermotolerans TaxID=2651334 RepID=A0A5P9K352_9HYPH|nr:hypothetical protein [Microvirga thermotolerans]QFU16674.1 hypothetical protein GDR74_10780 [Microvirga thermotolerans]
MSGHWNTQDTITEERLTKALEVLSSVVAEHGEKHLPLLRMIEGQLAQLRARKERREQAPALPETMEKVA